MAHGAEATELHQTHPLPSGEQSWRGHRRELGWYQLECGQSMTGWEEQLTQHFRRHTRHTHTRRCIVTRVAPHTLTPTLNLPVPTLSSARQCTHAHTLPLSSHVSTHSPAHTLNTHTHLVQPHLFHNTLTHSPTTNTLTHTHAHQHTDTPHTHSHTLDTHILTNNTHTLIIHSTHKFINDELKHSYSFTHILNTHSKHT